jgi:hypothetical protein
LSDDWNRSQAKSAGYTTHGYADRPCLLAS